MPEPFFSIVIPTYNRLWGLKEAIASIQTQTFQDFEVIISDDCSSDGTREWCGSLNNPKIKYYYQAKNLGIAKNWNYGIRQAGGKYITLLMDDDGFYPDYLQARVDAIQIFPNASMYYSGFVEIDSKGIETINQFPITTEVGISGNNLFETLINHPRWIGAFTFEKQALLEVFESAEKFGIVIDFAYVLKIADKSDAKAVLIPGASFWMRKHPDQTSNTKTFEMLEEAAKLVQSLSIKTIKKNKALFNQFLSDNYVYRSRLLVNQQKWRSLFYLLKSFYFCMFGNFKHRAWIFKQIISS